MISFSTIFLLASALREIVRDEETRNPTTGVSGENDEQTELRYSLVSEVRDANNQQIGSEYDPVTEAPSTNDRNVKIDRNHIPERDPVVTHNQAVDLDNDQK